MKSSSNSDSALDRKTRVGSLELGAPVLTASGTSGHGGELGAYFDLSRLGAVVVKSLSASPFSGNPPPRLVPAAAGMLNSVGLQGPGVERFLEQELPALEQTGARVVVSIWGRRVEDYAAAARLLVGCSSSIIAIEVNVSCPNVEDREKMFAHSKLATKEAIEASKCGLPRWAKLSPNVSDIAEIAAGALEGGAEALVLVNTLLAISIDRARRRPSLGGIGGGLSGPALKPVGLRAVFDCRSAFPDASIIGVGGISSGEDAAEYLLAGANAVQVGTATLLDPRAPLRVLEGLERLARKEGLLKITELVGAGRG